MSRAGRLRERVTIERLTSGAIDAYGNTYSGWSAVLTRWGDIIERLGKEAVEQGALQDVVTATLRLRRDADTKQITTADRVVARGATWAIRSIVQTDAKGALIEILIERGVAT
jgi:head-tail adaptor